MTINAYFDHPYFPLMSLEQGRNDRLEVRRSMLHRFHTF